VSDVAALIALLDEYHITDRSLVRARERARTADNAAAVDSLHHEVRRYFAGMEREAGAQLASIDRKLEDLYQRQYNLQAERGVAERRLVGARRVLGALRESRVEETR
jgi:hypothetical protein